VVISLPILPAQQGIFNDKFSNENRPFSVDCGYSYYCDLPDKVCVVYAIVCHSRPIIIGSDPVVYNGSALNHLKRFREHYRALQTKRHHNPSLSNAWDKYSPSGFSLFVLEHCDADNIRIREQEWIDAYRFNFGYRILFNATSKVDRPTGTKMSLENRRKASDRMRGNKHGLGKKWTASQRKKISQSLMGNKNGLGKSPNSETRARISKALLGRKASEKLIDKLARPFRLISPDGELIEGRNIKAFARQHGLNSGNLYSVLKGTASHHKGWRKAQ